MKARKSDNVLFKKHQSLPRMNDGTIYNCQSCFPAASRLCHLRQRFGQSSYPVIKLEPQYLNCHCQGEKIWLTHFKKVTSTICLEFVFDHKIDILKQGPLIHKKVDQRKNFNPSPSKMASRLHLLGWRRTISLGTYLMEPRGTKPTCWLSFNFKLLHRRMPTNDFFFT